MYYAYEIGCIMMNVSHLITCEPQDRKYYLCAESGEQDGSPFARSESDAEISVDELMVALKRMKNRKTAAEDGLVAEMLKTGHRGLLEALATFFTGILSGKLEAPVHWKSVQLKLIFKSGDPDLPKNYRPVSIIPVMAKLFSTVL